MEKSASQKLIRGQVFDENPEKLNVSILDSELTIILEADGIEAAYTANEAREFTESMLSAYHQSGWGENIVPTADYICDLADVVDNKVPLKEIEEKWDHDGTVGGGQQYEIVADTGGQPVMSFSSKREAMEFCEDWNSRPSWVIGNHLEEDGEPVAIWNLTEAEGAMVAERMEKEITQLVCSDDALPWEISVEYRSEIPTKDGGERIFDVGIRNQNYENERYIYQIYYSMHGEGINTLTQQPVTIGKRVRIDRQRGRLLEVMSKVPKHLGLYFGRPDADLEWLTLGEAINPDKEFP